MMTVQSGAKQLSGRSHIKCADFTSPFSFKLLSCPAPEPDLGVWDVHTCLVFLTDHPLKHYLDSIRAVQLIACDSLAHLVSKASSVIGGKSPAPIKMGARECPLCGRYAPSIRTSAEPAASSAADFYPTVKAELCHKMITMPAQHHDVCQPSAMVYGIVYRPNPNENKT